MAVCCNVYKSTSRNFQKAATKAYPKGVSTFETNASHIRPSLPYEVAPVEFGDQLYVMHRS